MLKLFLSGRFRLVNLKWYILEQQIKTSLFSVIGTFLVMLLLSAIISGTAYQPRVEAVLNFPLFSSAYYWVLTLILIPVLLVSLTTSIWFGYPVSRDIKKRLQTIADAADAVSRGKLNHRLPVEGQDEISELSEKYNVMADKIENQVHTLQRLVNQNEELLKQAQQIASLEERRKLAQELHDAVSQQLFAVSMSISALPRLLVQKPEQAQKLLAQVEGLVNQAQQELKALILHLRPVTLDGQSLKAAVEQLLQDIQQRYPDMLLSCDLEQLEPLEEGIENQLFRIVQEGVSNMLRHAKATKFKLLMNVRDQRLLLLMEDNGQGFDLSKTNKSSVGLSSMNERVEQLGGRLDMITAPGHGTRIEIRVPIETKPRGDHD
jgi:NarL family two-component system sensor histidine kinase LiaS